MAPFAISVVAWIGFSGGFPTLGIPAFEWPVKFAPGKELALFPDSGFTIVHSATAEVEIAKSQKMRPLIGGNFGRRDAQTVMGRFVAQDGTAPTMLYEDAADLDAFRFLDNSQAGSAYVAMEGRGANPEQVLVIGVGGGIDVMIALAAGAAVTAVEVNRGMIEMVTEGFDDYLGGLFRPGAHPYSDRLELVHGEGRSFARSQTDRYDIIQMSGVDSFTALSSGAYTLSESYLYTTEAVKDFYARLEQDGYISYSRFFLSYPKKPRETLRLSHIAATALRELGVEDAASQIVVFQGSSWASTLIKRGAFTQPEIDALDEFARLEGFHGLIFDPLEKPGTSHRPSPVHDYPMRQEAARILRPAYPDADPHAIEEMLDHVSRAFAATREGRKQDAAEHIHLATANAQGKFRVVAAKRLGNFVTAETRRHAEDDRHFEETRSAFSGLLLGSQADRERFLTRYPYDLRASTDDSPFYFNYYKYGALLQSFYRDTRVADRYHPDYPVGHMVLLTSLAQITLIAALLILLPLRFLERHGVPSFVRWRVFAYFAALGAGFMFIEIVLMQKMVLFLGHPTYSITVVLPSLLAWAGVGSLVAGRIPGVEARYFVRLILGIVAVIVLEALALNLILPSLLSLGFAARVLTTVMLLLPLGILLGIPFPMGIRLLNQTYPELLPWGWAINGFLSVFSAIFCIIVAMAVGFTLALILAAAMYAAGFLAILPVVRTARVETSGV